MACSKCRSKAILRANAPAFSTNELLTGDTFIAAKSTILLKSPAKEQLVKVGAMTKVSLAAALDLISKGAPIWIRTAA